MSSERNFLRIVVGNVNAHVVGNASVHVVGNAHAVRGAAKD